MIVTILGEEVRVNDDDRLFDQSLKWGELSVSRIPDEHVRGALGAFVGNLFAVNVKLETIRILLEQEGASLVPADRLYELSDFIKALLGLDEPRIEVPASINARVQGEDA